MADVDILMFEQAVEMLPEGDTVHTFRQTGPMLIGADGDRADIIERMRTHRLELSGPAATKMQHGMVLFDEHGEMFIETKLTDPA